MKLASALYDSHYPFKEMDMFDDYTVVNDPSELDKDSCLVVWGGADISPSLYNRPVSPYTHADDRPSWRDAAEWNLMQRAQELNIPIIGICRGAQMLCALAGGFLIQDVTNHTSGHLVKTNKGDVFQVSSLHHQMLYPFDVPHELVAWSKHQLSDHYIDVKESIQMEIEPEFVYFPRDRGIAIQWHPEFMKVNTNANAYVKQKLKDYL